MAIDLKSIISRSAARLGPGPAAVQGGENGAEQGGILPALAPRSQTGQRLQIGLTGLALMVLLVGLASVIKERVDQSAETVIADAVPVTAEPEVPAQSDPLADAGLVPDIPAEPDPETVLEVQPTAPASPTNNATQE